MIDRRKFMLGVGAAALAPVVAPAAPTLVGFDFGRDEGTVHFVRTGLPAVHWRKFYQGVPIRRVDELLFVEDWSRARQHRRP